MKANQENKLYEYDIQGILFLRKHKLNFTATYLGYGKHFPKDDQFRDCYNLTLSCVHNPKHKITLKFGQSIGDSEKKIVPTPYDLLSCITKQDPGDFEEFCSDTGYEIDSINARETYHAIKKEWEKVSKFFAGMGTALSELEEIN